MSNPAETYERELVPVLFEPWAPVVLDLANPAAGERVLDVACATGIVARRASVRVGTTGKITGLDLNPRMIEVARTASAREGIPAEWFEGNAETLPFGDGAFDLVVCQQGLQFMADRPKALGEMRRVLAPGGRVVLALWRDLSFHPLFAQMNAVIHRHLGMPVLAAPFALGDAEEIRALLAGAGFGDIEIVPHSMTARFPDPQRYVAMQIDVIAAAIPAAQRLDDSARSALVASVRDEMMAVIRSAISGGQVVMPMHAWLARGVRPHVA